MADKTTVKGAASQGHFTKDQSSPENDRSKFSEEEKKLKERLLDEKMKLIRQKNEERLRRQKEIEEDIKSASLHSIQVVDEKPAVAEHKMAGIQKDNSSTTRMRGRARGRILAKMAREELQAHRFENKTKQNPEDVENELQEEKKKDYSPRGGSSTFLSDDRRVDMSKVSSRSSHSWGGSQFEDVVDKVNKEKHARPRRENQDIEVSMTGKERKQYLEWKEERNRIDRERKLHQKSGESWKREWDREKGHRVHSTHERHDQHHTRRSGQRFGERTRRKPDWDLHDDRVPEKDLHHTNNNRENENDNWEERNDQKNSIASNDKAEDCDGSSSTSVERQSESSFKQEAISTVNLEDSTTTSINKIDDSNTNNERNESVDSEVIDSEIPKECHTTDKLDSKESEETVEPRNNHEVAGANIDIKNLTVTIDSKGKKNISDEPTNNNINSYSEMKDMVGNDKNESKEEAVSVKQDEIEQPKPQRIPKKHRHRKGKETQSTKEQEKKDLAKETEETNSSRLETQGEVNATEQVKSDSTINSALDSSLCQEKPKDSLPKLEIKKTDENNEPVPDFLKTPQKKNWADCEFDEELDLPPLEWDSLTK